MEEVVALLEPGLLVVAGGAGGVGAGAVLERNQLNGDLRGAAGVDDVPAGIEGINGDESFLGAVAGFEDVVGTDSVDFENRFVMDCTNDGTAGGGGGGGGGAGDGVSSTALETGSSFAAGRSSINETSSKELVDIRR